MTKLFNEQENKRCVILGVIIEESWISLPARRLSTLKGQRRPEPQQLLLFKYRESECQTFCGIRLNEKVPKTLILCTWSRFRNGRHFWSLLSFFCHYCVTRERNRRPVSLVITLRSCQVFVRRIVRTYNEYKSKMPEKNKADYGVQKRKREVGDTWL